MAGRNNGKKELTVLVDLTFTLVEIRPHYNVGLKGKPLKRLFPARLCVTMVDLFILLFIFCRVLKLRDSYDDLFF